MHFQKILLGIMCIRCAFFVPIEDAEEIAGDTLLWLWEHRQALNIQNSLGGYLLKSVYHKAINQIKENEIKMQLIPNF